MSRQSMGGILTLVGMLVFSAQGASPIEMILHDWIGVDWNDELVHATIELPAGAMAGPALAAVETGGGKPVPAQVSHVVRHPDESVKSCNVWFLASVPASGTSTYRILPGKSSSTDDAVTAKTTADGVELITRTPQPVGIRLNKDARDFVWPVSAAGLPGPVIGLILPSGRLTGHGRFEVPFLVKSFKTEIIASGPVFAEARVTTVFDVGTWTFTARVIRGCPVVVVREEFDNGWCSQPWDKFDRFYSLVLNDGDFKPSQIFYGAPNDRDEFQNLFKNGIRTDVMKLGRLQEGWVAAPVQGYTPTFTVDQDNYYLTGYPTVQPRLNGLIRLIEPGKDAVGLMGMDTAYWRNPMSLRIRSNRKGEILASLPLQMYEQNWASDGFGRNSPNYTGKTLFVPPNLARRCYGIMLSPAEDETKNLLASMTAASEKLSAHPLDTVKDMILDWPDPMAGAAWAKETSKAGADVMALMRDKMQFMRAMGDWGRFSMAYHYGFAKGEYPSIKAVIDSTADLTAENRKELRRLCAYLAYDMHSAATFPFGAGFHLNNPNMSVMAMEAQMKSSVLIKDHPMFRPWGEWSLAFLHDYIRRFTRDSGAPYENAHYSLGVTLDWSAQVNNLLIENGIGDAFDSELFRKSMRFVMDWLTPPDPRFLGHRMVIPYGNCSYQSVPPTFAQQFVAYYNNRVPELAGQLQWFANQTLPPDKQIKIVEKDLAPPLVSTWYQDYGVYFRHGFGTPYETLFMMFAGNCDGHCEWESDQMTYTLYAKGQPINLHFGNGYFPMFCRPWLRNRVSIDHKFEISERNQTGVLATAFTPAADYLRAYRTVDQIRGLNSEYPILNDKNAWAPEESKSWPNAPTNIETIPPVTSFRQVLFLKDDDPKGPNYFVVRDGFGGTPTRPTDISYWFLANSMTRQDKVFHFDGQCGVDMDVFVNTPETFEPETGEYGHQQQPYMRLVGFDPKYFPGGKLWEKQLFLRIKQPAGKGYMTALYPRLKGNDPAATFTRLSDSAVRIQNPVSSDLVLMAPYPEEFKDNQVQINGTAVAVRTYPNGRIVVVNGEGSAKIRASGKTLTGEGPFIAVIENGKVDTTPFSPAARISVE